MRKFLFGATIILSVLLIAFLITPAGTWMLFAIYKMVSTPEEKLSAKVSAKAKWQTRNGVHHD
jgi:hypothetical protein